MVYYDRCKKNEATADKRTVYFQVTGTLPSKASLSINGAGFANSTNAPATVSGNHRKLVLTQAEVNFVGKMVIDVTTTVSVDQAYIILRVGVGDPFANNWPGW